MSSITCCKTSFLEHSRTVQFRVQGLEFQQDEDANDVVRMSNRTMEPFGYQLGMFCWVVTVCEVDMPNTGFFVQAFVLFRI